MGSFSIWHILILEVIALVLFGGRGKVSDLMGISDAASTASKRVSPIPTRMTRR